MEVNGCFKVLTVPKPIGHLLDGLKFGVEPFRHSIRNGMSKIGQHIMKVFMDHPGRLYHRFQTRVRGPKVPLCKVMRSPSLPCVAPEISKTLLDRPGSGRLG